MSSVSISNIRGVFRKPEDTLGTVGADCNMVGVGRMWLVEGALLPSLDGGTEAGRSWRLDEGALFFASISPLAPPSLLVNDEMAHPVQELSFCGVPMRGAFVLATSGGGRTLSGMV